MKGFLKFVRNLGRKLQTRVKHLFNRCLKKAGLSCFFLVFFVSFPSFSSVPVKKYPIIITQEQRVGILEDRISELERENQMIHPLEIEIAKATTEVAIVNKSNRALRVTLVAESALWIAILIFLACV